ncbi:hypothetical protein AVEN_120580-1 [Araneus ventricosus]|uniref:Uncharacterized protein n=1 Tax=Araneus ventricosus TaxID=182803 RepID=A0A4Y2H825_ARAVE|nr:hypothetical protein AVEN_120580-1 [Araneus ventricosus]
MKRETVRTFKTSSKSFDVTDCSRLIDWTKYYVLPPPLVENLAIKPISSGFKLKNIPLESMSVLTWTLHVILRRAVGVWMKSPSPLMSHAAVIDIRKSRKDQTPCWGQLVEVGDELRTHLDGAALCSIRVGVRGGQRGLLERLNLTLQNFIFLAVLKRLPNG